MWEHFFDLADLISIVVEIFGSSIWRYFSEDFRLNGAQSTGEEEIALFSWKTNEVKKKTRMLENQNGAVPTFHIS
jgi:hypothetical protein